MSDENCSGVNVVVYRGSRRAETYIYLPEGAEFADLPEALQSQFGHASAFLEFTLHAEKKLAQADAPAVLAALAEQGFYLQMPPPRAVPDLPEVVLSEQLDDEMGDSAS